MYITEMRCDSCQTKISDGDDFEMIFDDSVLDAPNLIGDGIFIFTKKPTDLDNQNKSLKHFCGEGCMFKFISKKLEGSPE